MSINFDIHEFSPNQMDFIQKDKTGWLQLKRSVLLKASTVDWMNGGLMNVTLGEESVAVQNISESVRKVKTPKAHRTPNRLGSKNSPDLSLNETFSNHSFAETERYALKKLISEAEKKIIEEIKNEFDEKLKAFEDHNQRVAQLLERERAERELEQKLKEINQQKEEEETILRIRNSLPVPQLGLFQQPTSLTPQSAMTKPLSSENSKIKEQTEFLKQQELKKQHQKELNEQRLKFLDTLIGIQKEYNAKYLQVLSILQTSRAPLKQEFNTDLNSLKKTNEVILYIVDKCKGNGATQTDLDLCVDVSKLIDHVIKKLKDRNDEFEKKEEEAKRAADEVDSKLMEKETEIHESIPIEPDVQNESVSDRLSDRDKYYDYISNYLINTEKSLENFIKDEKYKSFRRDCQRAVNTPVNAISPTSSSHLLDKLKRLDTLLSGGYNDVAGKTFSVSSHPLGITYVKLLLARKIVAVGEEVVSSHPDTAYAVATVVASLIPKYPQFAVLLFGCFYKVCPYLIPRYWRKEEGESDKEYNKRLGFTYNERGEKEEMDKFLKRMSGVVQMFGALLITPRRRADSNKPYPLGVAEAWQWITTFITKDPKPDISATLLLDMLEVTGHFMIERYAFSFQKLLYLICTDYISRIEKVTPEGRGGPLQRLKTFLQDVIKVQRISPPKGLISSNFW